MKAPSPQKRAPLRRVHVAGEQPVACFPGTLAGAFVLMLGCSGNTNDVRFEAGGSAGNAGVSASGGAASGGATAGGATSGGSSVGGNAGSGAGSAGVGMGGNSGSANGGMGTGGAAGSGAASSVGGGAGATGGAAGTAGTAGTGAGGGGGEPGECNGPAGCVLNCPQGAPCTCECPAQDTCGGIVCEAGQSCFGTPECGYCYPEGTDPAGPICAGTTPCGDRGLECTVASGGFVGQLCVIENFATGPANDASFRCVLNTCGDSVTCDSDCAQAACVQTRAAQCTGVDASGIHCQGGGACASPDTPIETPNGPRPIAELTVGDLVFSTSEQGFVVVPLQRVSRTPVKNHHVVQLVLESGATLNISAGHPTADGRLFANLVAEGQLDGQRIVSREVVPYPHAFTYDILPASSTGTYVAGGALIGSTLQP